MSILCRLGIHDFPWPPHYEPTWSLWEDFQVECARGCGAREVKRCVRSWGDHWREKHPEPKTEAK